MNLATGAGHEKRQDEVGVGRPHGQDVLRLVGRVPLLGHALDDLDAGLLELLDRHVLGRDVLGHVQVHDADGAGLRTLAVQSAICDASRMPLAWQGTSTGLRTRS